MVRLARLLAVSLVFAGPLLPLQAPGQAAAKMARVGMLHIGDEAYLAKQTDAFIAGMSAHGYTVGKNLALDIRYTDGNRADVAAAAKDLIANSDVVFAPSGTAALAALKQGSRVPIVFCHATSPVEQGLAKTLGHPGGTTTGLTIQTPDLIEKRLSLLREILPGLSRVAYLRPSWYSTRGSDIDALDRAAKVLGVEVRRVGVKGAEDLEAAFDEAMRWHAQVLTLADAWLFITNRQRIVALGAKHRIPVIYGDPTYVRAGGLMSYGADGVDLARRAAGHVDKILKGTKPGDIPIEQPVKFELVINARTAKALGVTIPQSLLLRADRVVE